MILEQIEGPEDLRSIDPARLPDLAEEIRQVIISTVTKNGGHLGSNLGAVELTIAIHRVFRSPQDVIIWDTGHQSYTHKLLTGRQASFSTLRQEGGISGYPRKAESPHDWVENSHASTAIGYAHGLATALRLAEDRLAGTPWRRHVWEEMGRAAGRLDSDVRHLRALSPQRTLQRGYAVVTGPEGTVIRRAADLSPGDELAVSLAEGSLAASVISVNSLPELGSPGMAQA